MKPPILSDNKIAEVAVVCWEALQDHEKRAFQRVAQEQRDVDMEQVDLLTKAIAVIEELTCHDDFGSPDASPEKKLLARIYTFAHVAKGWCANPHADWVQELEEYYSQLEEAIHG